MKSWRTTVGGLLLAVGALIKPGLPPEYNWVAEACIALGGLILGTSARDNIVSSEQAKGIEK